MRSRSDADTRPDTKEPSAIVAKGRAENNAEDFISRPSCCVKYVGSQACITKKLQLMQLWTWVNAKSWRGKPLTNFRSFFALTLAVRAENCVEAYSPSATPRDPATTDSARQPSKVNKAAADNNPAVEPRLKPHNTVAKLVPL